MAAWEILEVWLDAGEPIEQVPDSLKMAGYTIDRIVPGVALETENYQEFFMLQVHS